MRIERRRQDSMSQTERVLRIQQMLQARKVIPREEFLGELEVSLATFKRDLEFLRSRFQVNIEWSRERGGYHCEDLRSRVGQGSIPGPCTAQVRSMRCCSCRIFSSNSSPVCSKWISHPSSSGSSFSLAPSILSPIRFGAGFAS